MKNIKKYFIISCIIAIIFGTLQHFAYDISNNNILVGLISPVNESVWEHLKLVLLPLTLFAIITKIKLKQKNVMIATSIATITACMFILIVHYTFLLFNIESATVDIIAYILSIMLAFYIIYIFYTNNILAKYESLGFILIISMFILFGIFTFYPPQHELFLDKNLNIYGIP